MSADTLPMAMELRASVRKDISEFTWEIKLTALEDFFVRNHLIYMQQFNSPS